MPRSSFGYVAAVLGDKLDKKFEIRDAQKGRTVVTNREDARCAVPLDPVNCVFGRSSARNGRPAIFLRTKAYVVISRTLVLRYILDDNARAIITANDIIDPTTGKNCALAGVSIVLHPPSPAERLGVSHKSGKSGKHLTPAKRLERLKTRLSLKHLQRFSL